MSDVYLVKLANGDVQTMSHAELDDAFEHGIIGERTPILPPGKMSWTTIAKLGGFDTDEFDAHELTPSHPANLEQASLSPMSFVPAASPSNPSARDHASARRASTKVAAVIAVAASIVVVGIVVSVTVLVLGTKSTPAAAAAAAAAPPPPPPVHHVGTEPAPAPKTAEPAPPAIAVSALPTANPTPKTKKVPARRSR